MRESESERERARRRARARARERERELGPARRPYSGVSICTFVLVK